MIAANIFHRNQGRLIFAANIFHRNQGRLMHANQISLLSWKSLKT